MYSSASGERFQHVTSMERVAELAKTHPMVSTLKGHLENLLEARVLDERGRASSGDQSNFWLSLSLAEFGKVMNVAITTRPSVVSTGCFGLWWRPKGSDWSEAETRAARMVFNDLMELDARRVKRAGETNDPAEAASGAASDAPDAASALA